MFDSYGHGLQADEQSGGGTGFDARITVAIVAGDYIIGIGDYPLLAVDTDGTLWSAKYAENSLPPDDFGSLYFLHTLGGTHPSEGTYSIHLVLGPGDDIPEPASLGLLGAGLIGLGAAGRRRARAALRLASS
ncbi:MAG: PEP-CTERM sorting domain-containing protein [Rhodospirillales bacterium]|nr:PEP-CTERM sorting domain-containing protein [Rhodospirillales bacterium]